MKRKRLFYWYVALPSVLVPLSIGVLYTSSVRLPLGDWIYTLPHIHAGVNALTALVLCVSLWCIRQNKVKWHRKTMLIALGLAGLFLVSYVLYHSASQPIRFGDINKDGVLSAEEQTNVGILRTLYLWLLLSHIVLAVVVVFLVLWALYYAHIKAFKRHKRIVKWAFPIWLYVSVSGVSVYAMIEPYY